MLRASGKNGNLKRRSLSYKYPVRNILTSRVCDLIIENFSINKYDEKGNVIARANAIEIDTSFQCNEKTFMTLNQLKQEINDGIDGSMVFLKS